MPSLTSVLYRAGLVKHLNYGSRVSVAGTSFRVPIRGRDGTRLHHLMEHWMVDVLEILAGRVDGAFIDVGVNVGQTLLKKTATGAGGRYVGFEPNPACVAYVHRLIDANGLTDCTVYPLALSNEEGATSLNVFRDETDSAASLTETCLRDQDGDGRDRTVGAYRVPLDAVWPPTEDVGILKMDVEGHELNVVKGARRVLQQWRPVVLCEILPAYSGDDADRLRRQDELLRLFGRLGYDTYRVRKAQDRTYRGVEPIEEIGRHGDMLLIDYVMVPVESGLSISDR